MRRGRKRFLTKAGLLILGAGLVFAGATLLWIALTPTPDLSAFADRKVTQSTKIYDRTGETILYDLNTDLRRKVIPLGDIAPAVRNATIAIEDAEFYQHIGIRPLAIVRAVFANLTPGGLGYAQGGSTITQQVVKNAILTREKSVSRKIREWVLAVKLEQRYSKDEILEFYLNETPYGGAFYGVEEAMSAFFGKSAKDATLSEAAYLAALPQAPTYYSPYGNNREALETRKNLVLARMLELGFIDESAYDRAQSETVVFRPQQDVSIIAPHFVFFIRQYLEEKYGPDVVVRGYKVITTLDVELQWKAEEIVNRYALQNVERFDAENAALVALDPTTGQILVMVGSRNYFDPDIDGNYNAALASRQPGSAFKPFVYATALAKGFTRDTLVFDVPTQFSTICRPDEIERKKDPCYAPENYDNAFRGPVTFQNALAQSINIPAVKVLYLAGITEAIRLAESMGITSLADAERYGLTLVLGGGEVRLLDMVSAYGTFATEGIRNPATGILRIEDGVGTVLEEFSPKPSHVLAETVARDISYMLSDNEARTPAFGAASPLYFPGYEVAAKTGTTNDSRDAWIVGYTPSVTVGAWAGNNDNSPMVKQVAGFIVAPLWNEFMREALVRFPKGYFGEPTPTPQDLPPVLRGQVTTSEDGTGVHDILHWIDTDNPRGPLLANPADDPQYPYWEYGVQHWLSRFLPTTSSSQ